MSNNNEELSAGGVDMDARRRLVKISQEPFNPPAPQKETIESKAPTVGHTPGEQVLAPGALSDRGHATTETSIVIPYNQGAPNSTGNHPTNEVMPLYHYNFKAVPVDLDALRGDVSVDEQAKREPANLPPDKWYPKGNA